MEGNTCPDKISEISSPSTSFEDQNASEQDICDIVNENKSGDKQWRDYRGATGRLQQLLSNGINPSLMLTRVLGYNAEQIPTDPLQQWEIVLGHLSFPTKRKRLPSVNSLEQALGLLKSCHSIMVVCGAGISVSCGIPDFRSRDGIYARLKKDFPDLATPQQMFDLEYFSTNPSVFFRFAKELFPGTFQPSLTHRFIGQLEKSGKLLRNYTQNIDTLESIAGLGRVIYCHGSFSSATCTACGLCLSSDAIKPDVMNQQIAYCPLCKPDLTTINQSYSQFIVRRPEQRTGDDDVYTGCLHKLFVSNHDALKDCPAYGVLKPDIVFFGEDLSRTFHSTLTEDIKQADLVLVIGSSLKVRPVSLIPHEIDNKIPQILINRESLADFSFDVELLGNADVITSQLVACLDHQSVGDISPPLTELSFDQLIDRVVHSSAAVEEEERSMQANTSNDPTDVANDNNSDDWSLESIDLASILPANTYVRIPPNRYVFQGSEYIIDPSSFTDDDSSSSSETKDDEADDSTPVAATSSSSNTITNNVNKKDQSIELVAGYQRLLNGIKRRPSLLRQQIQLAQLRNTIVVSSSDSSPSSQSSASPASQLEDTAPETSANNDLEVAQQPDDPASPTHAEQSKRPRIVSATDQTDSKTATNAE